MLAGGVRVLVRCVCPCVCGLALALYTTAPTRWPCFRTPYIAFGRAVRVLAFGGGECVNGGPFVSRWRCSRRSAAAGEQCAMPTSARRALQHTERTEPSLLPAGFILPSYALSLPVAISPHHQPVSARRYRAYPISRRQRPSTAREMPLPRSHQPLHLPFQVSAMSAPALAHAAHEAIARAISSVFFHSILHLDIPASLHAPSTVSVFFPTRHCARAAPSVIRLLVRCPHHAHPIILIFFSVRPPSRDTPSQSRLATAASPSSLGPIDVIPVSGPCCPPRLTLARPAGPNMPYQAVLSPKHALFHRPHPSG